ncbi:hypothetical protein PILCRDRAFT_11064 [Piloderma croceum F 1598]|uniref:DUF6533 domain-containing protein n=1 Tax=Piloderma croceum (strain F 1598) TaxID=765440 RepID=A0A0C3AX77_PILCF|nr:hypothetical protein PILCRDRAFT_11064 [Piloderma croceum F 1598]
MGRYNIQQGAIEIAYGWDHVTGYFISVVAKRLSWSENSTSEVNAVVEAISADGGGSYLDLHTGSFGFGQKVNTATILSLWDAYGAAAEHVKSAKQGREAYDYMLTMSLEISVIWAAPWSVPKALFLLTRYTPIIDSTAIMYYLFHPGSSIKTCRASIEIGEWMFITSVGFAEIILMIRTWAVWERDRRLTIGLSIFFVSVCMYAVAFRTSCSDHSIDKIINFKSHPNAATNPSSKLFGYWTQLHSIRGMGSAEPHSGILLLMSIKAYQTLRSGPISGLARLVYVDGILYYIALFGTLKASRKKLGLLIFDSSRGGQLDSRPDFTVSCILQDDYENLFSFLQRIMHSVLTGRMLLQLRQYDRKSDGVTELMDVSIPMEFVRDDNSKPEYL